MESDTAIKMYSLLVFFFSCLIFILLRKSETSQNLFCILRILLGLLAKDFSLKSLVRDEGCFLLLFVIWK